VKLALGTAQFGLDYGISNQSGQTSQSEVNKILTYARQHNIKTLDTSCSYGNSEAVLGQYSDSLSTFKVITKTPSLLDDSLNESHEKYIFSSFEQSLQQLQQNTVYGLLVHACDDLLKPGGHYLYNALQSLKSKGLVKKIGVSIYSKQQLDQILEHFDVDIVQLPFNILDQRLLLDGSLTQLKRKNIEVHARSIFLQGLLLLDTKNLPKQFTIYKQELKAVEQHAAANELSKLELMIGFTNGITEIDQIICGVNNCAQLTELVKASDKRIVANNVEHLAVWNEELLCPVHWK